jgi:hypothetical protein
MFYLFLLLISLLFILLLFSRFFFLLNFMFLGLLLLHLVKFDLSFLKFAIESLQKVCDVFLVGRWFTMGIYVFLFFPFWKTILFFSHLIIFFLFSRPVYVCKWFTCFKSVHSIFLLEFLLGSIIILAYFFSVFLIILIFLSAFGFCLISGDMLIFLFMIEIIVFEELTGQVFLVIYFLHSPIIKLNRLHSFNKLIFWPSWLVLRNICEDIFRFRPL